MKDKIDTLQKVFQYAVYKYTDSYCLGTRDVLAEEDEVQQNGRVFKKVNIPTYIIYYNDDEMVFKLFDGICSI